MSDVERSDDSNQAVPWRPPLSLILVSVAAVGVAVVHVALPSLTIDVVTLGLLAVAALPWLAPVVKSFRFGSLEVDLRDLQQSVREVRSRVEESVQKVEDLTDQVQRIVFSGAVDAGTRTELETAMSGFFTHLRQAGLPLPSTEPHVEVVDKGRVTPVYYSARTGKIMVARKLTGDLGRVLWSYGDYLCSSVIELPPEQREAASDNQRRNLETRERQANLDGLAWGGTLWRVRTVLGADTADKLLIQSWKAVAKEPVLAASASFASTVVELTEQQRGAAAATQVQEVFRKRGLVLG